MFYCPWTPGLCPGYVVSVSPFCADHVLASHIPHYWCQALQDRYPFIDMGASRNILTRVASPKMAPIRKKTPPPPHGEKFPVRRKNRGRKRPFTGRKNPSPHRCFGGFSRGGERLLLISPPPAGVHDSYGIGDAG